MGFKPATNAAVRTTTAITMFNAGIKSNVLANSAEVTVNHRVMAGDTIESVLEHDIAAINDDRIKVEVVEGVEASPISDPHTAAFREVERSVKQTFEGVLTAPGLMIAATDTKHYLELSHNVYRFQPILLEPSDLPRFHGIDERISTHNLIKMAHFYYRLIKNAQSLNSPQGSA
eukprot:TRINITY_DN1194_c0_g1_i3.p3 TRINITY_DN1194_c0_g1~~TRINITY_DN1194_c0_g1_i3.p3  ORF type:complete len:174 (-),score=59.37 TRINITY_DN1194_c0_g1_i3:10-531(-)